MRKDVLILAGLCILISFEGNGSYEASSEQVPFDMQGLPRPSIDYGSLAHGVKLLQVRLGPVGPATTLHTLHTRVILEAYEGESAEVSLRRILGTFALLHLRPLEDLLGDKVKEETFEIAGDAVRSLVADICHQKKIKEHQVRVVGRLELVRLDVRYFVWKTEKILASQTYPLLPQVTPSRTPRMEEDLQLVADDGTQSLYRRYLYEGPAP